MKKMKENKSGQYMPLEFDEEIIAQMEEAGIKVVDAYIVKGGN